MIKSYTFLYTYHVWEMEGVVLNVSCLVFNWKQCMFLQRYYASKARSLIHLNSTMVATLLNIYL